MRSRPLIPRQTLPPEEFKSAFEKAMNLGRPVVIDCQIDSDDKVWPMVAPGAAISEAFDEADLKNK